MCCAADNKPTTQAYAILQAAYVTAKVTVHRTIVHVQRNDWHLPPIAGGFRHQILCRQLLLYVYTSIALWDRLSFCSQAYTEVLGLLCCSSHITALQELSITYTVKANLALCRATQSQTDLVMCVYAAMPNRPVSLSCGIMSKSALFHLSAAKSSGKQLPCTA